jgi:hypothetical protein
MTGDPSPRERQQLAMLESLEHRVQRIHGLVERFAAEQQDPEPIALAVRRAFAELKVHLSGAGLDAMAQTCAALEIAARRSGGRVSKVRVLREGVGSLRFQIEAERRGLRGVAAERRSAPQVEGGAV